MANDAFPRSAMVELDVDREAQTVHASVDTTLNDALRNHLGLTATKVACEMGNCGACTVLLDGEPIYSCLVLAVECDGSPVETVASLSDGEELGAVQQAFVDHDALQCGFCTPGQVLAVESVRRRAADGETFDDAGLRNALAGNLCRCGAYQNILGAARSVVSGGTGDER